MLGFLFHKKRQEVSRLLHGRVNQTFVKQVGETQRSATRGAFCEVAWLIPYDARTKQPDCSCARPVVTKDISISGLSLIHNEAVTDERTIVGLQDETGLRFLLCTLQHCSSLGHGFHQVGLYPDEVIQISPADADMLPEDITAREEEPVGV
jgi:hypothetical protein